MNSTPRIHEIFACIRCGLNFNNFHSARAHYLTNPLHFSNLYLYSILSEARHIHAIVSTIDFRSIATPSETTAASMEAIEYPVRNAPQQPPKMSTRSAQVMNVYTDGDEIEGLPPRKRRRLENADAKVSNPR